MNPKFGNLARRCQNGRCSAKCAIEINAQYSTYKMSALWIVQTLWRQQPMCSVFRCDNLVEEHGKYCQSHGCKLIQDGIRCGQIRFKDSFYCEAHTCKDCLNPFGICRQHSHECHFCPNQWMYPHGKSCPQCKCQTSWCKNRHGKRSNFCQRCQRQEASRQKTLPSWQRGFAYARGV